MRPQLRQAVGEPRAVGHVRALRDDLPVDLERLPAATRAETDHYASDVLNRAQAVDNTTIEEADEPEPQTLRA